MKGVSPVVATVLMVAVAIAAAVVAYSWFMSMQASVQAEASRGAGMVGKDRIAVEAVQCSGSNLNINVRNIGDEPIDGNFTITVKDADTGVVKGSTTQSANIAAGSVHTFSVPLSSVGLGSSCSSLPQDTRVIVAVMTPNGSVNSKTERIA